MTAAIVTASASVVVAMFAFALNQIGQVRQERRQARLARVNAQLRELYGPLNTLLEVNETLWQELRGTQLPSRDQRTPDAGGPEWRAWRDTVLMPTNRQIRNLIVQHADLLVEGTVPASMRDFCAHVAALEIVIVEEGQGMHRSAMVPHPGAALSNHVHRTFTHLKATQRMLLGDRGADGLCP